MFAWAKVSDIHRFIEEKRWGAGWTSTRGWEYPWMEELLQKLNPTEIADCGCGASPFTVRLVDKGFKVAAIDNFSSVATETSKDFIEINKNKLTFVDCSLLDIPWDDNQVDCVICISVMEHIADKGLSQRKALAEMCRIVRPGGHIIVTNDTFLNAQIAPWWNPPEDARWAVNNCNVEFLDPKMADFKKEDLMFEDDLFVIPPEPYIRLGYGKPGPDGSGAFNLELYHRLTSVAYILKKESVSDRGGST